MAANQHYCMIDALKVNSKPCFFASHTGFTTPRPNDAVTKHAHNTTLNVAQPIAQRMASKQRTQEEISGVLCWCRRCEGSCRWCSALIELKCFERKGVATGSQPTPHLLLLLLLRQHLHHTLPWGHRWVFVQPMRMWRLPRFVSSSLATHHCTGLSLSRQQSTRCHSATRWRTRRFAVQGGGLHSRRATSCHCRHSHGRFGRWRK